MNESSTTFFKQVLLGLDQLSIPYRINSKLVRGLDYYCHTVFEFVTTELGAQGALLAGGRYDGLVETMGGAKTPGVGWASGVDRLADMCEKSLPSEKKKPISIISLGDKALAEALSVASQLREKNIYCEVFMTGNFKKKLEKANKFETEKAILIFEQENGHMEFKLKDFKNGEEKIISKSEISTLLNSKV